MRSLAGGNETVPTVLVGERALVNPFASEVLRQPLARAGRAAQLLRIITWSVIGVLVALSVAADTAGQAGLSWLADGAAVAIWLLSRLARHQLTGQAPGGRVSRTQTPEG